MNQIPDKRGTEATISAVGGRSPSFPSSANLDDLAEIMVKHWEHAISAVLPDKPDLIVLPEMCDRYEQTPPEILPRLRPRVSAGMTQMLSKTAREHGCYIAYATTATDENGLWRNAVVMLDRSGRTLASYYKNFLVSTEIERGLTPGATPCLAECDFGRVGFVVCFDLNFTELLEAYRQLKPDLIVFPSHYHGGVMQPYWAYQTRAHFLGCMGMAGIPSEVYSPVGQLLASSTNYFSHVTAKVNLNCAVVHLDFHWEKLRALKIRHGRDVLISDPGQLGAVLVTCQNPALSITRLIQEFEIETLDSYLDRSRALNQTARI